MSADFDGPSQLITAERIHAATLEGGQTHTMLQAEVSREALDGPQPPGWINAKLVDAGFDLSQPISVEHDVFNGKVIYTQVRKNKACTETIDQLRAWMRQGCPGR